MTVGRLLYDSHLHTYLCNHAFGDVEFYCLEAFQRNLKGVIFTCHCPEPDNSNRNVMSMEDFPVYIEMVQDAEDRWQGRLDVLLGLEVEYLPGKEKIIEDILSRADFHFVLGSLHPFRPDYCARYVVKSAQKCQAVYFELLAYSAKTQLFDCLAHPDLVKNQFPKSWNVRSLDAVISESLDVIAESGISMELNTSGLLKPVPEMNPSRFILEKMYRRGIPVVLGSDAHHHKRVADEFESALNELHQIGYSTVSYYKNRKRIQIDINEALESIAE